MDEDGDAAGLHVGELGQPSYACRRGWFLSFYTIMWTLIPCLEEVGDLPEMTLLKSAEEET